MRALCESHRYREAAALLVRLYAPELFGFVLAVVKERSEAEDVFASSVETFLTKLPTFRWECSLRTWGYVIVRRRVQDHLRARARDCRSLAPIDDAGAQMAPYRSTTKPFLKTDAKARLRELRQGLSPADQALLVLRLDRGLSWNDLARTFLDDAPSEEVLLREAARLRQRYATVKKALRSALTRSLDDE